MFSSVLSPIQARRSGPVLREFMLHEVLTLRICSQFTELSEYGVLTRRFIFLQALAQLCGGRSQAVMVTCSYYKAICLKS